MLVCRLMQVLWGHAVQFGRVRGDLTEQVKTALGLGGAVDVYLSRQEKKDILGKGNSIEMLRGMKQGAFFQEVQVFYDWKIG